MAAASLFACEDDPSGGSPDPFVPEAGAFDATTPPPPNLPDAAPDAPAPTAAVVRVLGAGAPVPNVTVVWHDAAGAVLGTSKTGADGRASSEALASAPGMASALLHNDNRFNVVTWTQIALGDELVLEASHDDDTTWRYDVSFPAQDAYFRARVGAGCERSGETSPIEVFVSPDCLRASTPVLVEAYGPEERPFAFAFKKGSPRPGDAGSAVPVTVGAFAEAVTVTVDVMHAPEDGDVGVGVTEIAEGIGFPMGPYLAIDGPRSFPVPSGFGEARQVFALFHPYDNYDRMMTIIRRDAPQATNVLDLAQLLPALQTADVQVEPDPRRFQIDWTSAASLATTDGGLVRVRYSGPQDANYAWTFVVPPTNGTAGSVKAPAMPAEAEGWLPPSPDSGFGVYMSPPEVLFVEASQLPDYAAFRRVAGSLFNVDAYGRSELNATLPSNGTLRATSYESYPR